jgi:NADH:ubiquinone oxidoreductase subunit 5 (subunit L)/multisubunit Na+/H+ antiporter MnhA subunit
VCKVAAGLSSLQIWVEVCVLDSPIRLDLWGPLVSVGSFNVSGGLHVDALAAHMLLTVTCVSAAVHLYAWVSMRSDPHLSQFLCYLSLFTGFMMLLVMAEDQFLMLVGWEGIGVCSYLLIGYWSTRVAAVKSAQKSILVNRVCDGLQMWALLWIWSHQGSDSLHQATHLVPMVSLAVCFAAMGKSAQMLFHGWLADAMEGPTPVSALMHAATLVTAGAYLTLRLGPDWLMLVGCLTAVMAGVLGPTQKDLKRVIATSTCSQMGVLAASIAGAVGHLLSHASFKAALFLSAGVQIQAAAYHQHASRHGAGPCGALLACSLSLVGWPELPGFDSKETLLSPLQRSRPADVKHTLLFLAAILTSSYTNQLLDQIVVQDNSKYTA